MKNNFCYSDYTIIDIETTGLSTYFDSIIEASVLRVRDNKIVSEFSELIFTHIQLDDFIVGLTGITNQMLVDKDKVRNVLPRLMDFVGNDIMVGHNISFDINFIECKQDQFIDNYYVDTLGLSRRLIKDVDNHRLDTIASYFNIERGLHRGLSDCNVTYQVYENLKRIIIENKIDFIELRGRKQSEYNQSLNSIKPNIEFDEQILNNYFCDKTVVVTGKMDNYSKIELGQIIVNCGGYFSDSINKKTDILILGNQDYQESIYGVKSNKHQTAIELQKKGHDITIIDEQTAIQLLKVTTSK